MYCDLEENKGGGGKVERQDIEWHQCSTAER
jgi:hypothetical protein